MHKIWTKSIIIEFKIFDFRIVERKLRSEVDLVRRSCFEIKIKKGLGKSRQKTDKNSN